MDTVDNIQTIIILAGDVPQGLAQAQLVQLLSSAAKPLVIVADGGANVLTNSGFAPDIIIGDGDSVNQDIFPNVERKLFPAAKNFTDGQAAFEYALDEAQPGNIAVFGAFGGRIDHFLANLSLPLLWPKQMQRFIFFGTDCKACYSPGQLQLAGAKGDTVSLLAMGGDVLGITLNGFAYPLQNYQLSLGSSRGISNIIEQLPATISHQSGNLLVIHYPHSGQ